jgi:hypothetical protein
MYGLGDWVVRFRMERRRREVDVIDFAFPGVVVDFFGEEEDDDDDGASSSSSTIAAAEDDVASPSSLLSPPPKAISGLQPGGPTARRASVFNEGISRMIIMAYNTLKLNG